MRVFLLLLLMLAGCRAVRKMQWPENPGNYTGSGFYRDAAAMGWESRDSLAQDRILSGHIPAFLRSFVPVSLSCTDSLTGKRITATCYVAPDYLSVGTAEDWARICITPHTAQRIADSLDCFLPTRKLVDAIWLQAVVKPEPVPMYAYRDSTPTMWQHHLIIEGQRKGSTGLIAGIKKDVILSSRITAEEIKRADGKQRLAIYGWHRPDGKPIQPLYTGHIWWWVDYSQGIRLVWRKLKVGNKWMDYTSMLQDPVLSRLLCDEITCTYTRYPVH